ncbi:winged helix-turn-helix domain-containing protein [Actinoplanes sp. NPDC051861]|uniref:winged helix-turn-helix domain-containing protein n=1 Tax=Actinoplanes sp. NPDC051861 TaxID=3155170 RepID=UPI00343CD81F
MLRYALEPADLLAVRFESRPGPLDDASGASRALRQRPSVLLAQWRREVLPRLPQSAAVALMLTPPAGVTFGFGAPLGHHLEDGLEAVLATPREQLLDESRHFVASHGALPGALRRLPDGDPETLRQVTTGLRAMYEAAIAPYESCLNLIRDADVALRALHAAREGLRSAIGHLHRTVRLNGMVLEIDRPFEQTVRSSGLGIVLIPSPWVYDEVRFVADPSSPLTVVYPTRLPVRIDPGPERSLGRLLGGTRARLLAALSDESGPGTQELARELGISSATASEHLGILRAARLISTHRGRNGAVHRLTATGKQLLGLNL